MTPLEMQDELVSELKEMFKDSRLKSPCGDIVPIKVYPQDIPVAESDDDEDPIPYIIVRLSKGTDSGAKDSFNTVSLVIIIGVYDSELDQQGYRDAMNIVQRIYERFHINPNLNGKAVYSGEFSWAMQEDGYYPYFFAACSLNFYIPAIRREDEYA